MDSTGEKILAYIRSNGGSGLIKEIQEAVCGNYEKIKKSLHRMEGRRVVRSRMLARNQKLYFLPGADTYKNLDLFPKEKWQKNG